MGRPVSVRWEFYLIAPLVVLGVFLGLSLSLRAVVENIRTNNAFDQVLLVLDSARHIRLAADADTSHATEALLQDMALAFPGKVVAAAAVPGKQALLDPWGGFITVQLMPGEGTLALDMRLTPAKCRHIIMMLNRDDEALSVLKRVDVLDDVPDSSQKIVSRMVYEAKPGWRLESNAVNSGCESQENVITTLKFRYK